MTMLAPILTALPLLVAARLVARSADPAVARKRAIVAASVALALAALSLAVELGGQHPHVRLFGVDLHVLPEGLLGFTNFVTCTVGLIAVGMSPLATHPPATLARMLLLLAIALAFFAVPRAGVIAVLWTMSAAVAWFELRSRQATRSTARLFAQYQGAGVVLMALGAVLFALERRSAAFVAWSLAIALREAVIPLHGWFPAFVQRAPLGLVVAFAAPQLGVYAHLQLFSDGALGELAHGVAAVGAVTAVLGAMLGVVQADARRALAFLVMSQTGLVAFGLENESEVARAGALLAWQVLALATSGFAMTLAALEARRGTLSLRTPTGSFARTPRMAVAFLFLGFASIGFPSTIGFVAEDLLVQGSIDEFPLLVFALITATALNGMTVMRCFFALFSGTGVHKGERDLTRREAWVLSLVMALLMAAGVQPGRLMKRHAPEPTGAVEHAQSH